MTKEIILDHVDSTAILILNRPERHNSLVPSMLEQLLEAIASIKAQTGVQAVVLEANGRSFSTGGDVRAFAEHSETLADYANTIVGLLNQVILALLDLPFPVIAAVHGIVTGGSLGLVLACDEVLVSPKASFTPYYSVVGFSPDGGWTALLPGIIGPKRAAEVLFHNRTISAEQAVAWGMAHHIVPAESIRRTALEYARDIAGKKASSLQHTRRLLTASYGDVAARLEAEKAHFIQQITSQEARQGMSSFLNHS